MKDLQHGPIHVVNMALNLVAGKRLSWQQRKAASFTVAPFPRLGAIGQGVWMNELLRKWLVLEKQNAP